MRFSTGAVRDYARCGGSDLPETLEEARLLRSVYQGAGHIPVTWWENGDVWGSDFRDGPGDVEPSGGSELPDLYFFTGHGSCQNPPTSTSPDFLVVCGNFGTPDTVNIGTQSRWGNGPGPLKFLIVDASCPMDLVSLAANWFPVFVGLHVAVGHSGTVNADTLDSSVRGYDFAQRTIGFAMTGDPFDFANWFIPKQSVGWAWMDAGLIDIEDGCSPVAIAAGATEAEAVDRRDNEKIDDGRPAPTANWLAWRWRTA